MDVVVVGGGIVGLSSAHALAAAGADVTLCESDSLGTGSTARSAGGIRTQFSTPVNVRLSIESLRVWEAFEELFGVDIAHRQSGYLFLARTPETADRFRESVAMQNDLGVDSEFLSPAAAVERCPGLDPDGFVGATYDGADGFADPNLAVQGYAASAREAGVDVRTGRPSSTSSPTAGGSRASKPTPNGSTPISWSTPRVRGRRPSPTWRGSISRSTRAAGRSWSSIPLARCRGTSP